MPTVMITNMISSEPQRMRLQLYTNLRACWMW
jgi:hypothetical protein